ncbi:hypothetical protein [Frankia tisae]|uniref:hypothetical protein n=1 Tax=Frankia tisae TaxID=2950104 RepID=UPI0021C215CB|nr:hypothetical protein [Frankia tisae]
MITRRLLWSLGVVSGVLGLAALVAAAVLPAPAALAAGYAPDTCRTGYVWREATPADHVCVTPVTRSWTAADNRWSVQALRAAPGGCASGYVRRRANAGDHACVTPATRSGVVADNAAELRRLAWAIPSVHTVEPEGCGPGCTTSEGPSYTFSVQGYYHNTGARARVIIQRVGAGRALFDRTVPITVVRNRPGGYLYINTGLRLCGPSSSAQRPNAWLVVTEPGVGSTRQVPVYLPVRCPAQL